MRMSANNVNKIDEIDEPMEMYSCMPLGSKPSHTDWKKDAEEDCHLNHTEDVINL